MPSGRSPSRLWLIMAGIALLALLTPRGLSWLSNLDLNTSAGQFEFSTADTAAFLTSLGSKELATNHGLLELTHRSGKTSWTFSIDTKQGLCRFQTKHQ